MDQLPDDIAMCVACLLGGEGAVTLRAVDRFWHRAIRPVPLVRAFAASRLEEKLPPTLSKGRCARADCTFWREEIIFCNGHGRVVRHDITSPYCPRHKRKLQVT
jgi:hypothetical protein